MSPKITSKSLANIAARPSKEPRLPPDVAAADRSTSMVRANTTSASFTSDPYAPQTTGA